MVTVQNGKGSNPRPGNEKVRKANHAEIAWRGIEAAEAIKKSTKTIFKYGKSKRST